jgi:hypothetical protein
MANLFEMERVIASGSAQELICQTLHLPAPAEEIKEIRKTVIIDNCMVVFDKVIIDGRLRKDILFKAAHTGFPIPGPVQGCTGVTSTVVGTLKDLDVEIAFNLLIPVPGARPEDRCVVLQAFVEGEKEEPANIQENGTFHTLIDKSIIFVCVKVVREVVNGGMAGGAVGVMGQQVSICPPRRSTGFFPGGNGTIPPARPGRLPGTFIGPTLIFPGVINPGIPTKIPPANFITSNKGTQVQLAQGQSLEATTTMDGSLVQGTLGGVVFGPGGTIADGMTVGD